jgi:hypothetical protein
MSGEFHTPVHICLCTACVLQLSIGAAGEYELETTVVRVAVLLSSANASCRLECVDQLCCIANPHFSAYLMLEHGTKYVAARAHSLSLPLCSYQYAHHRTLCVRLHSTVGNALTPLGPCLLSLRLSTTPHNPRLGIQMRLGRGLAGWLTCG